MKFGKHIIILVIAFLVGCSTADTENASWNFVARNVTVYVENNAGDNLLDSTFVGNILDRGFSFEYEGEIYEPQFTYPFDEIVEINPHWYGLRVGYADKSRSKPALLFGEFSAIENLINKDITINWGENRVDHIRFNLYTDFLAGNNPVLYHSIWLNSEEYPVEKPLTIKIVLDE